MDSNDRLLIAAALDHLEAVKRCLVPTVHFGAVISNVLLSEALEVACIHGSISVIDYLLRFPMNQSGSRKRKLAAVVKRRLATLAVMNTLLSPVRNREEVLQILCQNNAFSADGLTDHAARLSKGELLRLLHGLQSYGLLQFQWPESAVRILCALLSGENISSEVVDMAIAIIDGCPDGWMSLFFDEIRLEACPLLLGLWCQRHGFPFEEIPVPCAFARRIYLWEEAKVIEVAEREELRVFLEVVQLLHPSDLLFSEYKRLHPYSALFPTSIYPISEWQRAYKAFCCLMQRAPLRLWSSLELWDWLVDHQQFIFLSPLCKMYEAFLSSTEGKTNQALVDAMRDRMEQLHSLYYFMPLLGMLKYFDLNIIGQEFDTSFHISATTATCCTIVGHFIHGHRSQTSLADQLIGLWSSEEAQKAIANDSRSDFQSLVIMILDTNDLAVVDAFVDYLVHKVHVDRFVFCFRSYYLLAGLHSLRMVTHFLRRLTVDDVLRIELSSYLECLVENTVDHDRSMAVICENVDVGVTVDREQYPVDGLRAREELQDYLLTALSVGEAAYSVYSMKGAFRSMLTERAPSERFVLLVWLAVLPLETVKQLVEREYLSRAIIEETLEYDSTSLFCRRGSVDTIRYLVEELHIETALDNCLSWDESQCVFTFVLAKQRQDEEGKAVYEYLRHQAWLVHRQSLLTDS